MCCDVPRVPATRGRWRALPDNKGAVCRHQPLATPVQAAAASLPSWVHLATEAGARPAWMPIRPCSLGPVATEHEMVKTGAAIDRYLTAFGNGSAHRPDQDHRAGPDSPGLTHTTAASNRPAARSGWPSNHTAPDRRRCGSCNDQSGGAKGGAKGTRTPDLLHAMQTRYQLRHSPSPRRHPSLWNVGSILALQVCCAPAAAAAAPRRVRGRAAASFRPPCHPRGKRGCRRR